MIEKDLIKDLAELFEKYKELKPEHSEDLYDFSYHVRALQNLIAARSMYRKINHDDIHPN